MRSLKIFFLATVLVGCGSSMQARCPDSLTDPSGPATRRWAQEVLADILDNG